MIVTPLVYVRGNNGHKEAIGVGTMAKNKRLWPLSCTWSGISYLLNVTRCDLALARDTKLTVVNVPTQCLLLEVEHNPPPLFNRRCQLDEVRLASEAIDADVVRQSTLQEEERCMREETKECAKRVLEEIAVKEMSKT